MIPSGPFVRSSFFVLCSSHFTSKECTWRCGTLMTKGKTLSDQRDRHWWPKGRTMVTKGKTLVNKRLKGETSMSPNSCPQGLEKSGGFAATFFLVLFILGWRCRSDQECQMQNRNKPICGSDGVCVRGLSYIIKHNIKPVWKPLGCESCWCLILLNLSWQIFNCLDWSWLVLTGVCLHLLVFAWVLVGLIDPYWAFKCLIELYTSLTGNYIEFAEWLTDIATYWAAFRANFFSRLRLHRQIWLLVSHIQKGLWLQFRHK